MRRAAPALPGSLAGRLIEAQRPSLLDDERGGNVVLPVDHPAWRRDTLTLSAWARALFSKVKPYVIRVMSFWDHRSTSIPLDELILEIDPSGSYYAH